MKGAKGQPPPERRTAPAVDRGSVELEKLGSKSTFENRQAARPLVDRFGNRHSEAVLVNWSEAARRALGIHRANKGYT
jgi:hypothetical protein